MTSKDRSKKTKYNILIWGITLTIYALFTYFVQLSMPSDSSYAFFLLIGPAFLLIGFSVILVGIVITMKSDKKNQLLF